MATTTDHNLNAKQLAAEEMYQALKAVINGHRQYDLYIPAELRLPAEAALRKADGQ